MRVEKKNCFVSTDIVLICVSLMANAVEHLFMCGVICMSSLEKCLLNSSFALFVVLGFELRDFALPRQALYYLSNSSRSFCFSCFLSRVVAFIPRLAWTSTPHIYSSQVCATKSSILLVEIGLNFAWAGLISEFSQSLPPQWLGL
jgi:hypothetical protein